MNPIDTWLRDTLDYDFDDPALLQQALTHRSAAAKNNERLEFLGDAVLDFSISDLLYARYPAATEGELSRLRAALVRAETLAELAEELGVGGHLVLGSGEKKSGGHRRESILADALEAIFGAVFLDGGFAAARRIIESLFAARLEALPSADELKDPKTRLQEYLQARGLDLPTYTTVSVTGKAHAQRFSVSCAVGDGRKTSGEGGSRREAEQRAATEMLIELEA